VFLFVAPSSFGIAACLQITMRFRMVMGTSPGLRCDALNLVITMHVSEASIVKELHMLRLDVSTSLSEQRETRSEGLGYVAKACPVMSSCTSP